MDTVSIEDQHSGRSVAIRRPLALYLTSDELIALEDLTRKWVSLGTEDEAEGALDRMAADSPERVLYGLLWLTSLWCGLCHARVGIPINLFIEDLDYRGLRRELAGLDEQAWDTGNRLVRRGVLAVVTSDADVQEYLRIIKTVEPTLGRTRRHLLTLIDGLTQDMQRNGLAPWGAAEHVISSAGWTT